MTIKPEDLMHWLRKGMDPYYSQSADLIEELLAQNRRLREALQKMDDFITTMTLSPPSRQPGDEPHLQHCRCVYAVREMTRRALKAQP